MALILVIKDNLHILTSVCAPCSEIPRKLKPADWRPLMPDTRAAAARLVQQGLIEVTQKGSVVIISAAKGPIRLRLIPHQQPRTMRSD